MKANEVMTRNPNCCLPYVSARMAAGLLTQFDVGFLPVVKDLFTRELVGVITDRDLCTRVLATNSDPDEIAVQDCMTHNPTSCTAETDVWWVLALMAIEGVSRLPVVDAANRLQGIVSIDDLVRHHALPANEICTALGRITVPRIRARVTATGI